VFAGKWSRAFTVVPPPPLRFSRQVRLMPAQGMAAILSGHGDVLESEVLLLRSQLDLEQGRVRAAAVGLDSAFELLLSELAGRTLSGHVRQQLEQALTAREDVTAIAQRARRDTLTDVDADTLRAASSTAGATSRWATDMSRSGHEDPPWGHRAA
jgi:uncharacterized membrane protein